MTKRKPGLLIAGMAVILAASPGSVRALDALLTLDPGASYVAQKSPHADGSYVVPPSTLKLVFGTRSGNAVSVTVPPGSLQMGVLRGTRMPDVRASVRSAGFGSLVVEGGEIGALELHVPVTVEGNGQTVSYVLHLTTRTLELLDTAATRTGKPVERGTGKVELLTTAEVEGGGEDAGSFHAVISGQIEPLPEGLK